MKQLVCIKIKVNSIDLVHWLVVAVRQRKRTRTSSRSVYGSRKGDETNRADWFHQVRSDTDVRECGEGKSILVQ